MNIVILGAGESGTGAAILAQKLGYDVFVSDFGPIKAEYRQELKEKNIPFEENRHTRDRIFAADEIIKSPGIPDTAALIQDLNRAEVPVISEIEFASRHTTATVIGITGSNGKTTTTNLTYHLLHTAGFSVAMGGNVGYSFARLVAENSADLFVLELSSFQLDGIVEFQPHIATLLNITPDHLDRYDYQMANYIRSKFRIIDNQTKDDLFIYNGGDKNILDFLKDKTLSQKEQAVVGDNYSAPWLTVDQEHRFDMSRCSLMGPHNRFNACCAILAALSLGADPVAIQKGLDTVVNTPHRLELVATIDGVEYINDSKATNVDAVYYALKSMEKPVVWIAGGTDKGNDYSILEDLVKEKVSYLICLGLDNRKLIETYSDFGFPIVEVRTAEAAVDKARTVAKAGDVALLSPACASFDLFDNYAARGDLFKAAVKKLEAGSPNLFGDNAKPNELGEPKK